MRLKTIPIIFIVLVCMSGNSRSLAYNYGEPTPAEQAHLEAINWARAHPQDEASRLHLSDVKEGTVPGAINGLPQPPVTLNAKLSSAALSHSQDMAANDYFQHTSLDGTRFYERLSMLGYNYLTTGENIAWMGSTGPLDEVESSLELHDNLFIDDNYPDRGHRVNILSENYREVGIGLAFGLANQNQILYNSYYVTTDFGTSRENDQPFLLGVVYADHDSNGWYTAGEGLSGVKVTIIETGISTVTANAGGYALPMQNGHYSVQFLRPDNGQVTKIISLANDNVKVDVTDDEFILSGAPSDTLTATESDCLFNWGEDNYPALLTPSRPTSQTSSPYYFRYYSGSTTYLGYSTADNHLYFLDANGSLLDLGLAATWSTQAGCR